MLKATLRNPSNTTITGGQFTNVLLSQKLVNSAVSAAAGTTLTAAQLVGGFITRTGPTLVYTDTTDTALAIIAVIPNALAGTCFELTYINTVAAMATLAAGVGVTLTGTTTVTASSTRSYLGTVTSATTVELRGISAGSL